MSREFQRFHTLNQLRVTMNKESQEILHEIERMSLLLEVTKDTLYHLKPLEYIDNQKILVDLLQKKIQYISTHLDVMESEIEETHEQLKDLL